MIGEPSTIAVRLAKAAAESGLFLRGGFRVAPEDGVPALDDGRAPASLVLLGPVGGSMWPIFAAAPELSDGAPDPLDRWSRRVVGAIAAEFGGTALYPFGGPPYLPFQRWAMRAAPVAPSPLGILIHPAFGLWHGYRGALAFAESIDWPREPDRPAPCESCADRPCLGACPVDAFNGMRFMVDACRAHLDRPAGRACMEGGCLARGACPVGRAHAYPAEQTRFHMRAFRRAGRPAGATED